MPDVFEHPEDVRRCRKSATGLACITIHNYSVILAYSGLCQEPSHIYQRNQNTVIRSEKQPGQIYSTWYVPRCISCRVTDIHKHNIRIADILKFIYVGNETGILILSICRTDGYARFKNAMPGIRSGATGRFVPFRVLTHQKTWRGIVILERTVQIVCSRAAMRTITTHCTHKRSFPCNYSNRYC